MSDRSLMIRLLPLALLLGAGACVPRFSPVDRVPDRAFAWPPPVASARLELPAALRGRQTLGEVARHLAAALDGAGYRERSYYDAPNGFVLTTRLEQIDANGRPRTGPERWSAAHPRRPIFSLGSYLEAVFMANPGRYRLLTFVVTDASLAPGQRPPDWPWLKGWSDHGDVALPVARAALPIKSAHRCAVLVYEFQRPDADAEPRLLQPSALSAVEHLTATGVWGGLGVPL